ncbi:hypothetical protein N2152v2_009357 [Parachlorella kessleri]
MFPKQRIEYALECKLVREEDASDSTGDAAGATATTAGGDKSGIGTQAAARAAAACSSGSRALLLLAALPGSFGVNCSIFTDAGSCQNTVTDSGVCGWDDAAQKCVVTFPLPFGAAAISNGFTCAQQLAWGKCSEAWMTQGGFCQITCGVCKPGTPTAAPKPASSPTSQASPAVAPMGADIIETAPLAGAPAAPASEAALSSSFCTLPPFTGPCRGAIPSWYYNSATKTCMPFLYGGCQANANNFETSPQCEAAAAKYCQKPAGL